MRARPDRARLVPGALAVLGLLVAGAWLWIAALMVAFVAGEVASGALVTVAIVGLLAGLSMLSRKMRSTTRHR